MTLPNIKADTILGALKDIITRLSLQLTGCRGQGNDGASSFQGRISGVAIQIKEEVSAALPVHCLAHSLNINLQDIRDALNVSTELIQVLRFSPKRQTMLEDITRMSNTRNNKPFCPIRWTVEQAPWILYWRITKQSSSPCSIQQENNDEYSRRAGELLALTEKSQTLLELRLAMLVLSSWAGLYYLTKQGYQRGRCSSSSHHMQKLLWESASGRALHHLLCRCGG